MRTKKIKKDKRQAMVSAGAYDGRFKEKVVADKKKILHIKLRKSKSLKLI